VLKKIKLEEAVGTRLAHDITEFREGSIKGPAFRRGHLVSGEDLSRLRELGKNHLYVIELGEDEVHEDQAAALLAEAIAGEGVTWEDRPEEGRIDLLAGRKGLVTVDTRALEEFNMVEEVVCATIHSHTLVRKGDPVAATRAIPLVIKSDVIEKAAAIAAKNGGLVSVRPLRQARAGLVITGDEVYGGLVEDCFAPLLKTKLKALGSTVEVVTLTPDRAKSISRAIGSHLDRGCDLILLTGGMSVDPDDKTCEGILEAGAEEVNYGSAALPGAMFLTAYLGKVPLLGVPACALHHRTTVLDLLLPRILAGERIGRSELASLGHGGLCLGCPDCRHPHCPFGKGG
jgi:hypothetical protein